MKKVILLFSAIMLSVYCFGQETKPDTTKKDFKNIVGIDATGLIREFLNFGNNTYSYYPYMISYRRIFKNNALRIGVGGNIYNNDGNVNDSLGNSTKRSNFDLGLGIEHYCYLAKNWNFYFGTDAIVSCSTNFSKYSFNATSTGSQFTKQFKCGVSPVIGVVFKISSRIFLATETSFDIVYAQYQSRNVYSPASPFDRVGRNSGFESQYNAPVSLNFRMKF